MLIIPCFFGGTCLPCFVPGFPWHQTLPKVAGAPEWYVGCPRRLRYNHRSPWSTMAFAAGLPLATQVATGNPRFLLCGLPLATKSFPRVAVGNQGFAAGVAAGNQAFAAHVAAGNRGFSVRVAAGNQGFVVKGCCWQPWLAISLLLLGEARQSVLVQFADYLDCHRLALAFPYLAGLWDSCYLHPSVFLLL